MAFFRSDLVASLAVTVAAICAWAGIAHGASLGPGNLIASVNEFTGTLPTPTYVAEYTPTGIRVQILANVPAPGGTGPTSEEARDLVHGPGNAIHLYNGTFDPFLARLDLATLAWTQRTFAGWSTVNSITFGGLGALGQFVFATDMTTFGPGQLPAGIVRFDTAGGPTVRFAETVQPSDLAVGLDGLIYALPGDASPNDTVFKFDPNSFALLGTIPIEFADNRALAVAADGSLFVATFDGNITHYSAGGVPLDSLTVPGAHFSDIDIDGAGRIALGTGFDGEIVLTAVTLDDFTRFNATTNGQFGGEVFVAWVTEAPTIPVPPSGLLLAVAWLVSCGVSTQRRRRGRLRQDRPAR